MKKDDGTNVNAWLTYDKKMERERMARYEKTDAAHRKRYQKKQRVIRTPKEIIDLLRAEREDERSATAVAASLSSSSTETTVAASSASSSSCTYGTSAFWGISDQLLRDVLYQRVEAWHPNLYPGAKEAPDERQARLWQKAVAGRWSEADFQQALEELPHRHL